MSSLTAQSLIEVRLPEIMRRLYARHPDIHCELNYKSPFQLLVATILSAQTTDVRVNQVSPVLFAAYPTAADLAGAKRADVEAIIRPLGFFRQKARFIQETAHKIVIEFGGEVPASMPKLLTLTGVARKTANVVLGEIYGIAEGVTVDTHVKRIAKLLGMTKHSDPKKVEQNLMALVPKDEWINISHLLVFHGRRICIARRPECRQCPVADLCPAAKN